MRRLSTIAKMFPLLGLVLNRARFPGLHCGVAVEIDPPANFSHGNGVTIGAYSRLYLQAGPAKLGDGVALGRDVHIQPSPGGVRIGARTGVNDRAKILGSTTIGQGCVIAPNLYVSSGNHVFRSPEPYLPIVVQERKYPPQDQPVEIGDDCWIGVNVVILAGVRVGRGAVIGANSVVLGNVAPYAVVAGAPARQIAKRLDFVPPAAISAANPLEAPYFYSGLDGTDGPDGFACDDIFVLALTSESARFIALTILADGPGSLSHAGVSAPFEAGRSELRLPLSRDQMPFLAFHLTGRCRLAEARLLETSE